MGYSILDVKLEEDINVSNKFSCICSYSQPFKTAFDRNNTHPKSYARYLAVVVVILRDDLQLGWKKQSFYYMNCTCSKVLKVQFLLPRIDVTI